MIPASTLSRALDLPPDIPGVGRLCQELLAEITGKPITCQTPAPVRMLGGRYRRAA